MRLNSPIRAFTVGVLGSLFIAWLAWLNLFAAVNDSLYDQLNRIDFNAENSFHSVILHNDTLAEDHFELSLSRLLVSLQNKDIAGVVLVSSQISILEKLSALNQNLSSTQKIPVKILTPATVRHFDFRSAVLAPFETRQRHGIHREFEFKQLDNSLADFYGAAFPSEFQNTRFTNSWIGFNPAVKIERVINFSFSQALNGGLVDSVMKNKMVVVNLDPSIEQQLYQINSRDHKGLSWAEIQVLAMETVLNQRGVNQLSSLLVAISIVMFFTLTFFLVQLISPALIALESVALLVGLAGIAFSFQYLFNLQLPLIEILIVQTLSIPYILSIERMREEDLLVKTTKALNTRLNSKVQPTSFYASKTPWQDLHSLINQQLNLHRSIFLEKVGKGHRIQEIDALNCRVDDIQERRRDFERKPYSEAIETLSPVEMDDYFKNSSEDEREFMLPLMFAGDVLGFWAVTVIPDKHWNKSIFEKHVLSFSKEISELLFHRKQLMKQEKTDSNIWRRFFTLKFAQAEYEALDISVAHLEKRFDSLQNIFDGMSSASALFDMFGQILHTNNRMEQIANAMSLPIYQLTAHDLILRVTELDTHQIKNILLSTTLKDEWIDIPINTDAFGAEYLLRIRAIRVVQSQDKHSSGMMTQGLLFEFVEITDVQRIIGIKEELFGQYFHQMRNNLSTMNLFCRQVQKQLPDDKQQFIKELQNCLKEATAINQNIEEKLEQQSVLDHAIPLNAIVEYEKVKKEYSDAIRQKRLKFEEDVPMILSLVLAERYQLKSLFKLIFKLLIDDCVNNNGEVSVKVKDTMYGDKRMIQMYFTNTGYGLPQEQLNILLATKPTQFVESEDTLEQIILLSHQVRRFDLDVSIKSKMGEGYSLTVSLPVFSIQSQKNTL
jgi:signal transduction histidine kinase